jgi:hypothetical protein
LNKIHIHQPNNHSAHQIIGLQMHAFLCFVVFPQDVFAKIIANVFERINHTIGRFINEHTFAIVNIEITL